MKRRRLLVRTVRRVCPGCGSRVSVDIQPVQYARRIMGRSEAEEAVGIDCLCGERVSVSVGEARRAA